MKIPILLTLLASTSALATAPAAPPLHYQTGQISILGGQATLNTSTNLRYLDAADAKRVIVDLWGNPPEVAEDVQGMILPMTDLLAKNGWGVVITESKDGHVKDNDAAHMNYTQIMKDLQAGSAERNAERQKAGYPAVDLVGWADTPSYDAATHKMYWAKELAFHEVGQPEVNTP